MDFEQLVNEILQRVAEKVDEKEAADQKPRILVLTQEHGEDCHRRLTSSRLLEYYRMDCALSKAYDCDPAAYEAVILYQLTNEALGKLANGIYDTPYLRLAAEAVLAGKRIYVPEEEVELFRYEKTAPAAYYAMLLEKLNLLKASGFQILQGESLEQEILEGDGPKAPKEEAADAASLGKAPAEEAAGAEEQELSITKKIITERDVIDASAEKITRIYICKNAILTDLAKEYAQARKITFIRTDKKGGNL